MMLIAICLLLLSDLIIYFFGYKQGFHDGAREFEDEDEEWWGK